MKTKRERNKRLEFLQAYTNPVNRQILFSSGRSCGKTFLHKIFQKAKQIGCKNYLVQKQNAHKRLNSALQINFAEIEIRAIANFLKNHPDGVPDSESPTGRHSCKKENMQFLEKPTAKIENNGGFYSTTCPKCGKDKILSSELNTMTAVCNRCYTAFNLEK